MSLHSLSLNSLRERPLIAGNPPCESTGKDHQLYLNGHMAGFCSRMQKLEPPSNGSERVNPFSPLHFQAEQARQREQELAREENLAALLQTAQQTLIPNPEEFDCGICFVPVEPGEGVVLRECLHRFCRSAVTAKYWLSLNIK